jgi:hypothetical protein
MPATALPRFPRSGQCAIGLAPVADAHDQDDERTYSMSEAVAAIFGEDSGQSVA